MVKTQEVVTEMLREYKESTRGARAAMGFDVSSDTKYKLINTRRGRAYGSRARAEGMDMIPR